MSFYYLYIFEAIRDCNCTINLYSQGAFNFFLAVWKLPLDLSVIPMLLDFPTEFSDGDIMVDIPFCSMFRYNSTITENRKYREIDTYYYIL